MLIALSHREICCLLGTQIRDITRRLLGLFQPFDYYLILGFHVITDNQKGLQGIGMTG